MIQLRIAFKRHISARPKPVLPSLKVLHRDLIIALGLENEHWLRQRTGKRHRAVGAQIQQVHGWHVERQLACRGARRGTRPVTTPNLFAADTQHLWWLRR